MTCKSSRLRMYAAAIALAGAAAGCSQDTLPVTVRNLDRPSAAAFGCYGDLRITDGGPAEPGQDVFVSAQPLASCQGWRRGEIPPGQEQLEGEAPLVEPKLYGFLLQGSRGTVAVVDADSQTVLDSDPLTPGKNAIPIGTLPVGLTSDASGCFMVSASAASCELAVLDVNSAIDLREPAGIARVPVKDASGNNVLAKARSLVGSRQEETVGLRCPSRPSGLLYVAYPACHLVAVVDAESGQIQAGIQFAAAGTAPTITPPEDISCPSECSAGSIEPTTEMGGMPDADPEGGAEVTGPAAGGPAPADTIPRPVVVQLGPDGRLYVAAENSPLITAVELDETGLPTAIASMELQASQGTDPLVSPLGVTSLAVSDDVIGGGAGGQQGTGGETRYLYAVASDRTVRVVDVEQMVECDTQVDPRFVHDVNNLALLACFPVGGPDTPQRRPGAISPGIHFPGDETPLDVAISAVEPDAPSDQPSAFNMSGTFAFVTTTRGSVFVVNVDDDVYRDFEDDDDPSAVSLPLALGHQLRDQGSLRDAVATSCGPVSSDSLSGPPRVSDTPTRVYSTARIAPEKLHLAPSVRQLECTFEDDSVPVSELSFTAPVEEREMAFPDWAAVRESEQWSVVFEGVLSRDGLLSDVDGPPVRSGTVHVDGFNIALDDPSEPFCQMGVEPFDAVQLLGCDPSLGDEQCGLGETCFVHPDTPSSVTTGVCLQAGRTEELAVPCRDFLISRRQYSALSVSSDEVMLAPRRRVLRTSPLDGCVSDEQCLQMAEMEGTLSDPQHPISIAMPPAVDFQWVCTDDPTRPLGPDRCLMACESEDDCEPGNVCLAGYCNEGYPPGPECVEAVQRYQVRASDAFVVIGGITGYLHNRIRNDSQDVPDDSEDPGACVADSDASPLMVGRIPLRPPLCTGEAMTDISPNPCSVEVDETESVVPYDVVGSECVAQGSDVRTRPVRALRLQNPAFRLHLVDTETQGDATCNGDRLGELPPFSTVYPGFEIDFTVVGGISPMRVSWPQPNPIPAYPIRIVPAPDGRLWVLDQGDSGQGDAGRVFTMSPAAAGDSFPFSPTVIR